MVGVLLARVHTFQQWNVLTAVFIAKLIVTTRLRTYSFQELDAECVPTDRNAFRRTKLTAKATYQRGLDAPQVGEQDYY